MPVGAQGYAGSPPTLGAAKSETRGHTPCPLDDAYADADAGAPTASRIKALASAVNVAAAAYHAPVAESCQGERAA